MSDGPMNACRRAGLAALLCIASAASASAQTARTVTYAPASTGGSHTFAILLPMDYDETDRRYPVLYLLHGSGQNHAAFPARTWFRKVLGSRQMIVVMPDGGRSAERYSELIAGDLVRYVDANYRTIAAREGRAIGGISLGGLGAAMLGLRHPDTFAIVGTLSGAVSESLVPEAAPSAAPYLYVVCGTLDQFIERTRAFVKRLAATGALHEYHEVPGAGHTWSLWDAYMPSFVELVAKRFPK
jgi:putative tributyrin esterase